MFWKEALLKKCLLLKVRLYPLWNFGSPERVENVEYCFSEKLAFSKKVAVLKSMEI